MSIRDWWKSEGVWLSGAISLIGTVINIAIQTEGLLGDDMKPLLTFSAGALTAVSSFLTIRLGTTISRSETNSTSE